MGKTIVKLLAGLLVVVGAIGAVFLLGMRTKTPLVIDNVRRVNRGVTNKRVLRSAGTAGASASVIHHVGRSSGRDYATPIGSMATEGGYLVALPYGPRADWVKNVLAAGRATLVHDGTTYTVDEPTVVPTATVTSELPASELRTLRLFNVVDCLRLRAVEAASDR